MQESDTYLMILEEGEEKGLRRVIVALGKNRLGSPDESVIAKLNSITDLNRLERIAVHVPQAASWQEAVDVA